MINRFCTSALWECNKTLIAVAQGNLPADLVVRHARLISTPTREVVDDVDIAIACGRIAYVGLDGNTAEHCVGTGTQVIDARGRYAAPGFIDSHIHLESSMLTPSEFARSVLPHGTSAVMWDPHEIANVAGLAAVREMARDAQRTPLKTFITTPSCVPSVKGYEDAGAVVDAGDIAASMSWESTAGLGEMMNFGGVLRGDDEVLAEVNATLRAGLEVTGHYPAPDIDRGLNAYIAAGITADHESATPGDVVVRMRLGCYAQLRQGSAEQDLPALAEAIAGGTVDPRFATLSSDDRDAQTLAAVGHVDAILRLAVACGIDPLVAVQMATINAATCFHLEHEMGSIAPGKCADLVLFGSLEDFDVSLTVVDGAVAAQDGTPCFEVEPYQWPSYVSNTMNVGKNFAAEDFRITTEHADGPVQVRVIAAQEGTILTEQREATLQARSGELLVDGAQDVLKLCVFERHHASGMRGAGFVSGFHVHGALAQTVAHDAHNLLVAGDNDEDMALAANTLVSCGGGIVAVEDGEVLALLELPICGLLSPMRDEDVVQCIAELDCAWRKMGCTMPSAFMTMAFMSLPVIPKLRVTNRGLFDVDSFAFVSPELP